MSDEFISAPEDVIGRLSFSHICEIEWIDDPLVRYFYEQECMRCTWSVRELRRQIGTNLHIRVGLSKDPEKCLSPYKNGSDCAQLQVREPYTFEFLGLKPQDVVTESDLEDALINHLQEFLLEFGKGMCFEARQRRIIIDDEYYYPDLIFYNRIGHFSLIVELKTNPSRTRTSASLIPTYPTGKRTKCSPATIRPWDFSSAPRRERKWSSTPKLEWTTNSSSQPTSSSCRTKAHWKNSCCGNLKKINSNYQRERGQSDTPTDIET